MEENLNTLYLKLNTPTKDINSKILQEVLSYSRKLKTNSYEEEMITNIIEKLWAHLTANLLSLDDQLLCSTCFYSVLSYSSNQEDYLKQVINILDCIGYSTCSEHDNKEKTVLVGISLMYGIFQSSYLTQVETEGDNNEQLKNNILILTFKVLTYNAYEYSQFTFITFKIISSFKKVLTTQFQATLYNKSHQIKLLNVINHNWENPVTGVRNLNRIIFGTLIKISDKDIYHQIVIDINKFYWSKAKYLMLAEIIEQHQANVLSLIKDNNWIDGIIHSLHKPGLISAGSDMYYAILKRINTYKEWCELFLGNVLTILKGPSQKAIENFINYWCLITFKKFPELLTCLINELIHFREIENTLLSLLSVMKQGNKLGLVDKNYIDTKTSSMVNLLKDGLQHCNPHIRIMAFDIVCVSHGKTWPCKVEYEIVHNFLLNNVNSDCTVLRINMINSFSSFINHLHHCFLSNSANYEVKINELKKFYLELQNLVKISLELDGNYQRKITTVKLIETIFKATTTVPNPKQTKNDKLKTLYQMLKVDNIWILSDEDLTLKLICLLKDPADDIRFTVLQVLVNYYGEKLKTSNMLDQLIQDALQCCQSKFFYDIDCGKIIFKLIVCIILREKQIEARFKRVEDIFNYCLDELTLENKLKRNPVDSIIQGKQPHSILGILYIIFESCIVNEYKIEINEEKINRLLNILEIMSNQFQWEEDSTVSFDFSRMNDMVEKLIKTSTYDTTDQNDETKISGLHQIVLNCLWLNVKTTCELSSLLVIYKKDSKEICEKCLNIITHVLETFRHKGAIEAAGAALGKSIQTLTTLPSSYNGSQLTMKLLERKLKDLIVEAKKTASVTRRGAGLSIMIHRIVSSDMKKGKPLFHYFINVLLNTCLETDDTLKGKEVNDNEKDLPKAIFIHFLTRIVTDSSLASEVMYYSAKLAELAFENLRSPYWQIRNAALQLYGALIPKLIGQKKASGSDEETVATVACDEFRTHSPKLWSFILLLLKNIDQNDIIQSHSNLVPTLNILASVARRYNFSYDLNDQCIEDMQLKHRLTLLLGSPIYTVRRLVSKCIVNIFSYEMIFQFLIEYTFTSENDLHGVMMLIEEFSNLNENDYYLLKSKYMDILTKGPHSFLIKEIFERIFFDDIQVEPENSLTKISIDITKNKHLPGVFLWAKMRVKTFINKATWVELNKNLPILLELSDFEQYIEIIHKKFEHDLDVEEKPMTDVVDTLISSKRAVNSYGIWKFVYFISNKIHVNIRNNQIFEEMIGLATYKTRFFIPFAARISAKNLRIDYIKQVLDKIVALCHPDKNDTDMRFISALANNELASALKYLPDEVKINAISTAVILLQDEDEDIRNISTNFVTTITNDSSKHAFICLNYILDISFLEATFKEPSKSIPMLVKKLSELISSLTSTDQDSYNPFANDSKNIYFEDKFVKQLLVKINKYCE